MPSPPTLFDDDPGGQPAEHVVADGPSDDQRRPNYLARRAAVVAVVIVAVVAVAIVVGRLIGGGSGATTGAANSEWNRILVVDRRTGDVATFDERGGAADGFESVANPNDAAVVEATMVVAGDEVIKVIDLDGGATEEYEFGSEDISVPAGTTLTMIAPSADGGRGLLVHGPTGDAIDTDDAGLTGARYDVARAVSSTSGRHVLVTDTGNFQTILFSFDRDEPSYFPGLALAVDDDTVVTAQNVGTNATINIFDHDGQMLASGQTPSVRAAMLAGDVVQLVTADGVVAAMSTTTGDLDEGIRLTVGVVASGTVLPTGDRLVVVGADGTQILDEDGSSVGDYTALTPFPDADALRGSTCITLVGVIDAADAGAGGEGSGGEGSGGEPSVALIDARTGDVATSIDGVPATSHQSADGCTLLVPGDDDGSEVVTTEDTVEHAQGDPVAIAPDGAAVVVDADGDLLLVSLADVSDDAEPGDPVDLGTSSNRLVFFTTS